MSDELTTDQVREIAQDVLGEWLSGYHFPSMSINQVQLRQMADGSYRADPADGPRAEGTLGTYRITVTVERLDSSERQHDPDCERCNYATHYCPGCGAWVGHGRIACEKCR